MTTPPSLKIAVIKIFLNTDWMDTLRTEIVSAQTAAQ